MKLILLTGITVFTALFLTNCGSPGSQQFNPDQIHAQCLTIDSHTDAPFWLFRENFNLAGNPDSLHFRNQYDLEKMKAGGLDAVFFAVFVPQGKLDSSGNRSAIDRAKREFMLIHDAVGECSGLARIGLSPEDAFNNEKQGVKTIYIGIENGYAIGDSLPLLEEYYRDGARYITLCHTRNNGICDSSTDPEGPLSNGLSDFGEQVVNEMNRLGIMVDISHVSDKSFFDVLKVSKTPVIASHSDVRALCDHPRNLSDSMLIALKQNGGVIQMCLLSDYVKKMPESGARDSAFMAFRKKYSNYNDLSDAERNKADEEWDMIDEKYPAALATVSDLVDHIDHVVKLIGIDYVGIGSDFDGGGRLADCQDASQFGNITRELVKRGYSMEDIGKIWGGNLMRVFGQVAGYAEQAEKHTL